MAARPPATTVLVAGRISRVAPSLRLGALGRCALIGRCNPTRPPLSLVALRAYPLPCAIAVGWHRRRCALAMPPDGLPCQPCTLSPSCFASPACSRLWPLARCRHFSSNAPALTAYVRFGSPARTAIADGSSLPTTARPSSHVTLPAAHDGRGVARYARRRCPQRLPPPPLRALVFHVPLVSRNCSVCLLLFPTTSPALQQERNENQDYKDKVTHIFY